MGKTGIKPKNIYSEGFASFDIIDTMKDNTIIIESVVKNDKAYFYTNSQCYYDIKAKYLATNTF